MELPRIVDKKHWYRKEIECKHSGASDNYLKAKRTLNNMGETTEGKTAGSNATPEGMHVCGIYK